MTIIGDNYGETDTETEERFGLGGKNGNVCNHKFEKIHKTPEERDNDSLAGKHNPYYYQCSYCGKIKETIRDILNKEMVNYEEAKGIGDKNKVFDKTCDEIYFLTKETLQQQKEEILKVLPKEQEFREDENKYPDARWQKENYGKMKYTQALRQVKHNIETLTLTTSADK